MFSITSICINGDNYAQCPDVVEVFLLGRKQYHYTDDIPPPPRVHAGSIGSKYADWKAEDAQIRSCLRNSMESKIS